tara:strand:- start:680 stop:2098 length:1419 start_codon:yes stop_codon:yes gene_type:complete
MSKSKKYYQLAPLGNEINENLPEVVGLFPKLTYDQIDTILNYPVGGIGAANKNNGNVLATDITVNGVDTRVIITMELKDQLEKYLDSGAATKEQLNIAYSLTGGTIDNEKPTKGRTVRWPRDTIHKDTDYVFFQFGKYRPPFARDVATLRKNTGWSQFADKRESKEGLQSENYAKELEKESTTAATYNLYRSSEKLEVYDYNIMLPMPQDLSNEFQAQWQGKQFTATGRAAVAALGAGNFSFASKVVENIAGNAKALQTALNTSVLNSIPGVGGNLSFNDVSGSTRGIVINPNAELLYDSPEMREIGMIFKLVAQNEEESKDIRRICQLFRYSSLPRWGGGGLQNDTLSDDTVVNIFSGEGKIVGSNDWTSNDKPGNRDRKGQFDVTSEDNWIRVPDLCKFTFMRGDEPHPYIPQFKPCAIQAVEVNYTPDGTYATYQGGAPVAVELKLNFMETKIIYANEVNTNREPGVGF